MGFSILEVEEKELDTEVDDLRKQIATGRDPMIEESLKRKSQGWLQVWDVVGLVGRRPRR